MQLLMGALLVAAFSSCSLLVLCSNHLDGIAVCAMFSTVFVHVSSLSFWLGLHMAVHAERHQLQGRSAEEPQAHKSQRRGSTSMGRHASSIASQCTSSTPRSLAGAPMEVIEFLKVRVGWVCCGGQSSTRFQQILVVG